MEDLCELQNTAYRAAKRADPRCKVLLGAFAGPGFGYMDQLLRLGAKDCFDVVSIHPYSGKKENLDNAVFGTNAVRLVLAQNGCEDRPIWFTEIGWPVDLAPGMDAKRRAELLMMAYSHPFHESVEKMFWFPFDTWSRRIPPQGPGGLISIQNDKLIRTPGFYAYGKMTAKASQADTIRP